MVRRWLAILGAALWLGSTSFGGPTAHLAYFYTYYVQKKRWIDEKRYNEIVAISQFLPGPASSQVGMSIGLYYGGIVGSILSFIGFTLPSAIIMTLLAYMSEHYTAQFEWLRGLQLVAVVIVWSAIVDMSKKLLLTKWQYGITLVVTIAILVSSNSSMPLIIIICAILLALLLPKSTLAGSVVDGGADRETDLAHYKTGGVLLALFTGLLLLSFLVIQSSSTGLLQIAAKFYYAGALVFGGGHVVLPLLETQFVTTSIMSSADFMAGYSAVQAMPGPLFTVASYLGYRMGGISGAIIATIFIFLPAYLLIIGVLPFWNKLKRLDWVARAMPIIHAAVIGLLVATFIRPVISDSIHHIGDIVVVIGLLVIKLRWNLQPIWLIGIGLVLAFWL